MYSCSANSLSNSGSFAMMQQRKHRFYSSDSEVLPMVTITPRTREELQRSWSAPSSQRGEVVTDNMPMAVPKHHQPAQLPTTTGVVNHDYYDYYTAPRRSSKHGQWNYWPVLAVAVVLMGSCGLVYQNFRQRQLHQAYTLQQVLQQTQYELSQVGAHARQLESRLSSTRKLNRDLEASLSQLQEQPQQLQLAQKQLEYLTNYQTRMHNGIQAMSRRMTVEKFGTGPHYYVEMRLAFHPDSNVAHDDHAVGTRVVLETASLEEMPHTVHLFLEQVAHGLYDGTVFHRNAHHILQAGPSINEDLQERFRTAMDGTLHNVVFQEYTPEWNHQPYTIGYAGRPGGPDFYVNLKDNAHIHGPGGQSHHYGTNDDALYMPTRHADADPCFAKVVEGAPVMDRIARSRNRDGSETLEQHVVIQHMHILEHYHPASQPPPKGFEAPPELL